MEDRKNDSVLIIAALVLLLISALTSCSTSRKVSEVAKLNAETQIDKHSETQVEAKADTAAWSHASTFSNMEEDIMQIEYTPVPNDTGYTPVMTKVIIRNRRQNNSAVRTDSARIKTDTCTQQYTDSAATVREKQNVERRSTIKSDSRCLYYAPLIIATLLAIIYVLYHRKKI